LAEAYKAQALVLRHTGDRAAAQAALKKAIEVNPRFVPAIINLAVDAFCRADLAGAERHIRRSLDIDPQEAFAITWLGVLTQLTNRHDETLSIADRLRKASNAVFYVTAVHYFRASIQLARGDLAAAERVVREARDDGVASKDTGAIEAMNAARTGRAEDA